MVNGWQKSVGGSFTVRHDDEASAGGGGVGNEWKENQGNFELIFFPFSSVAYFLCLDSGRLAKRGSRQMWPGFSHLSFCWWEGEGGRWVRNQLRFHGWVAIISNVSCYILSSLSVLGGSRFLLR